MKLLLDTNVFIWLNDSPQRVSEQVMSVVANPDNDLCLSLTSIWEMQIKIQQVENNLELLTISLEHIWALENLPNHHKDPFDRLLIAQAQAEGMTLVSPDRMFGLYEVKLLW